MCFRLYSASVRSALCTIFNRATSWPIKRLLKHLHTWQIIVYKWLSIRPYVGFNYELCVTSLSLNNFWNCLFNRFLNFMASGISCDDNVRLWVLFIFWIISSPWSYITLSHLSSCNKSSPHIHYYCWPFN